MMDVRIEFVLDRWEPKEGFWTESKPVKVYLASANLVAMSLGGKTVFVGIEDLYSAIHAIRDNKFLGGENPSYDLKK